MSELRDMFSGSQKLCVHRNFTYTPGSEEMRISKSGVYDDLSKLGVFHEQKFKSRAPTAAVPDLRAEDVILIQRVRVRLKTPASPIINLGLASGMHASKMIYIRDEPQ